MALGLLLISECDKRAKFGLPLTLTVEGYNKGIIFIVSIKCFFFNNYFGYRNSDNICKIISQNDCFTSAELQFSTAVKAHWHRGLRDAMFFVKTPLIIHCKQSISRLTLLIGDCPCLQTNCLVVSATLCNYQRCDYIFIGRRQDRSVCTENVIPHMVL